MHTIDMESLFHCEKTDSKINDYLTNVSSTASKLVAGTAHDTFVYSPDSLLTTIFPGVPVTHNSCQNFC